MIESVFLYIFFCFFSLVCYFFVLFCLLHSFQLNCSLTHIQWFCVHNTTTLMARFICQIENKAPKKQRTTKENWWNEMKWTNHLHEVGLMYLPCSVANRKSIFVLCCCLSLLVCVRLSVVCVCVCRSHQSLRSRKINKSKAKKHTEHSLISVRIVQRCTVYTIQKRKNRAKKKNGNICLCYAIESQFMHTAYICLEHFNNFFIFQPFILFIFSFFPSLFFCRKFYNMEKEI